MTKNITQLENNNWIREFTEPWGAFLLLGAKPMQESCVRIKFFLVIVR